MPNVVSESAAMTAVSPFLTTTIVVYQLVALVVFGAIFYFAWDSLKPILLHR